MVRFAWQAHTIKGLRTLNQCSEGRPWEYGNGGTIYPSKLGATVVTLIHPGAPRFPASAPALIVKFSKGTLP